jgi:hypothetical protein
MENRVLLHVAATTALGLTGQGGGEPEFRLSVLRCVVGLVIILVLIVASFVARAMAWDDGASLFLHLTDIAVGGLVGLIVGERGAVNAKKR